jgi:hypothetical protein
MESNILNQLTQETVYKDIIYFRRAKYKFYNYTRSLEQLQTIKMKIKITLTITVIFPGGNSISDPVPCVVFF